jgi:hypothetical protein
MSIWSELAKYTQISPAIWVDPYKAIKELQDSNKDERPTNSIPDSFQSSIFPGLGRGELPGN